MSPFSGRPRPLTVCAWLALIAMTVVFLFPLLWVIGLSLKTRLQVFANPPLFVWRPTLENYIGVLGQADFLQAFVNSLVVSSGAVLLSLCVGVPAAYAFARFPFRGGSFLFFSGIVGWRPKAATVVKGMANGAMRPPSM